MAQAEHGQLSAVMFPWLELARRLTSADRDIDVTVHLVSTPVNLSAIARHQTPWIRFVELRRRIRTYRRRCNSAVSTCSAAAISFVDHCLGSARAPFTFQGIGLGSAEEEAKYMSLFVVREQPDAMVSERDRLLLSLAHSSGFVAVKTCADIERPDMSYLSELLGGKEIVLITPLLVDDSDAAAAGGGASSESDRVTRWLDAQDTDSVVLVSFGSKYFTEQQLSRMAHSLELSGERFVWVVRFPKDYDAAPGAAVRVPQTRSRPYCTRAGGGMRV